MIYNIVHLHKLVEDNKKIVFRYFYCTLTYVMFAICRGRPAHLPASDYVEGDSITGPAEEEASVIVQLTNRVQDGTRCRSGSLDMCIQGKCQVNSVRLISILIQHLSPLNSNIGCRHWNWKRRANVFLKIKLNALNYVHFMQAKWPCNKFPALMFATLLLDAFIRCCWLVWSLGISCAQMFRVRATRHRKMLWK